MEGPSGANPQGLVWGRGKPPKVPQFRFWGHQNANGGTLGGKSPRSGLEPGKTPKVPQFGFWSHQNANGLTFGGKTSKVWSWARENPSVQK